MLEVGSMLLRTVAVFLLMAPVLFSQTGPKPGQPAPDFTLKDSSGAPVTLSAPKGKVVLLDFWATWCHGCQIEIPWYVEFQSRYGKTNFIFEFSLMRRFQRTQNRINPITGFEAIDRQN